MSNLSEFKRLEADLKRDEGLRKMLDETVRRIAEEGKAKSDGDVMVAATAELGYDISVADLERASAEAEDVDDAELELVAGGTIGEDEYGLSAWCALSWHCYTAMLHSETETTEVSCWSDYLCIFIHNQE